MGVTWWCIFDWYSHGHPSGFQSMGLYNMDGDQEESSLKMRLKPHMNLIII